MRASNPLIAVGISAVVILGTTSAASAQAESSSDADLGNSKESDVAPVHNSQPDRKQTAQSNPSEDIRPEVASNAPASQLTSQNAARIEIFVAPESSHSAKPMQGVTSIASSASSTLSQTKAAQNFNLAQAPAAETSSPTEPANSGETAVEAAPSTPSGADAESADAESADAEGPAENTAEDGTGDAAGSAEDTAESTDSSPESATETAQESTPEPNEATSEPVAQDAKPTEEVLPESTEELLQEEAGEATQEEEVSPEAVEETTEELEQEGEAAEETEPSDDEPPQDTENILPEDREPSDLPNEPQPDNEGTSRDEIQPSAPSEDSTDITAPDYLDTGANPLLFPTTPEEVGILGTQPVTLEQVIEVGIRNNEELSQSRLELQRQRAALRETQAELYPNINANVNLNYNASEQPNSTTFQETDPNTGLPTGETTFEVDGTNAARSLTLGGAIELSYAIFTSGRRSALIESAERQVRFQELQVEADTEDLILQITNDYYDLQEADEQVQIFRATLEEAQRSLRDAEALERAGVGTRFDVLQAQVDVANALQNLRNQESQQEIARRQLAERLNLNQTVTLAAADPVEVAGVWDLSLEETIVAAYRNRAELEQQLVQREIAERNRRAALAQLGPQLNFQTSYGLNNTLESDPDSPNEDVGFLSEFQAALGVSMLLFDGGAARAQARQAEANIAIAESNFANQRDQIRFNVEQAYAQLQSNYDNIQTTALAVQQAVEALRLARLRFQAGVGTQTDVLQAQTALTQARFNNLQAILDYNRALASLQRQVSNYPEGYLNEVP